MRKIWLLVAALIVSAPRSSARDIVVQENRLAPIHCLALSDDGRFVITHGYRNQLSVWDTGSGALLGTLEGQFSSSSMTLGFSSDNHYVSYCNGVAAVVWDWLNRKVVWSSDGMSGISSLAVDSPRNKFFTGRGNDLRERSLADGKELSRKLLDGVEIGSLSLTEEGKLVILCKKTGIHFFDPDTRQVTRHLDLDYPKSGPFDEDMLRRKPELANLAQVAGFPSGKLDRSGSLFRFSFNSSKPPFEQSSWFQIFSTDGRELSAKHPALLNPATSPWLGETGKFLQSKKNTVAIIDAYKPVERETLAISLPGEVVTSLDTDRSGRVIAASTDQGWFCYEGDPGDPRSWKPREFPAISSVVTILNQHRDGKTLLYGSKTGAVRGISLEEGLPDRSLATLEKEATLIGVFHDGKLMVSTRDNRHVLQEGEPEQRGQKGEIHYARNCGDFILRNSPDAMIGNLEVEVVRSDGQILDSCTDKEEWPTVHPVKPLLIHAHPGVENSRFKVAEITSEGKYRVLHELERPAEADSVAIPESRDFFLLLSWNGLLQRIDARTGEGIKLRDGLPRDVSTAYLSPNGKLLVALHEDGSKASLIPLDAGRPSIELNKTEADFGVGTCYWIGFTPNQRGVWLNIGLSDLTTISSTYAGLWDTETGELVARFRAYENGAALILLPDGRCYFNQAAAGMVMLRKEGDAASPAESSPEVLAALQPYLANP